MEICGIEEAIKTLDKFVTEHKLFNIKHSDGLEKAIETLLTAYEKEKEKNKELEEMLKHRIKYTNELEKDLFENASNYVIPKSKVAEILKQRLNKYQDADDGEYKQEYLTRGELELVDRYKECSELLKILCEEDIYKIELDYIPKSKLRVLIEKFRCFGWHNKDDEYWVNRILDDLQELLEERN